MLTTASAINEHAIVLQADSAITYDFLNFSEQDCLRFVNDHNIKIPNKISGSHNLGFITKGIVESVTKNPDCLFSYSYTAMQNYAQTIQREMKCYLDCSYKGSNVLRDTYYLQYNTVKDSNGNWVTSGGAWDSRWEFYNCYAYSLHRNEGIPFYSTLSQYQPGDMSGTGSFDSINSIYDLAIVVKDDLEAMGYVNVALSTSIPSVSDNQELICVRMCEEDYHFMKYDSTTNAWYHKPGHTAILKYNYITNNNDLWYRECSDYNGEYSDAVIYDSDIYFITYNKNKVNISYNTNNLSKSVTIHQGKDAVLEMENSSNGQKYHISISSQFSVKAELYNAEMELLATYSGNNLSFYRTLLSGKYYLKTNFLGSNAFGSISIYFSAHFHSYDSSYIWWNYTQHRATCLCGTNRLEGHAVSSDPDIQGNQYAICLLCGGLASIGFVGPMSVNELPRTSNGSYILPNGVVVLVDEDFEAYINGTLVFAHLNAK